MGQRYFNESRIVKFEINSTGLVTQFIEKYQLWLDHDEFYKSEKHIRVENSKNGIPCYHYLDISNINKHTNHLIAIDCLTEGIHAKEFFEQYNKTNRYLIFSNGTWDSVYYNLPIDYKIVYHKFFLFEMADTYNTPNRFCYYIDKKYNFSSTKPYVFLSTVGNVRPERDYLVEKLKSDLRYKNFLLRYSGQDLVGNGELDVIKVTPGNFDPYIKILEKHHHNISQTLPINLFNQAHFNLIVESDINWLNEFFLTEKTIKNLIVGMPFIIVGTPHFLKNLKELGFETYSDLWDESYDDITDYQQRVDKIVELCNNLSTFDWVTNKERLIQIGQKNQLNFLNLDRVANKEFIDFEKTVKDIL